MPIRFFRPIAALAGVVSRIYAHDIGVSTEAGQPWLIAPDGDFKLIFPLRGGIRCTIGGTSRWHAESRLIVSGMRTLPGALEFPGGVDAIGVIIRPEAAYRLFRIPLSELANCTVDGEDVFGRVVNGCGEEIASAPDIDARVALVQTLLSKIIVANERRDHSVEHAVRELRLAAGALAIERVAEDMRWSRRRLERRFLDRVGVTPKNLASVFRFHATYKRLRHAPGGRYGTMVLDHYYDQSHFLRDFKRFTGLTPRIYATSADYGRFYIPS